MVKNSIPDGNRFPAFDPSAVPPPGGGAIAWAIHYRPVVASTQDLARQAARDGALEGWTMVTDRQEAGRGRLGRTWRDAGGRDLLFSTVLKPAPPLLSLLPLLAGLAVSEGVRRVTELSVDLKWPNDLLVGQRKLAGILLERGSVGEIVLGVGINVNGAAAELPAEATSVAAQLGHPISRERLLGAVLDALAEALRRAAMEGSDWVVPAWRSHSSMLGRRIMYRDRETLHEATAEDIEPDGALTVRLDDGTRRPLYAGEVSAVRPQS